MRGTIALGIITPMGLCAGAIAANAVSQPPDGPVVSNTVAQIQAVDPDLRASQTASDTLPNFLQSGPQSLDVVNSSARSLGVASGVRYWLAVNAVNQGCLIVLLPGSAEDATLTCAASSTVWKQGLALQAADPTSSARAYFLPTGYAPTGADLKMLSPQLYLGDASVAAPSIVARSASTPVGGSGTLTLSSFSAAQR